MSYQEKRNIVNILSTLLISAVYFGYVVHTYADESMNSDQLLKFWATTLLVLIPVGIVAKIIIYIAFGIFNTIATREKIPVKDEMDKLIELKATRNAQCVFTFGFLLAMVTLALGMSVNMMFVVIICSGIASEISENMSQLYFYRKGI